MGGDIFTMREDRIRSYLSFTFANSCMPTLLKAKPSSLITFYKKYIPDETAFYEALEEELSKFECGFERLYQSDSLYYVLVYYRPLLDTIIETYSGHPILKEKGYLSGEEFLTSNIRNFKIRFYKYQMKKIEFPHELGIMLGYPIEDVEGYIHNNGENYILCGYWKVYHNAAQALEIFNQYKKLRDMAVDLFYTGRELSEIKS